MSPRFAAPFEPAPLDRPRLTLDLVPRTCWLSNVRSAVTGASWDRLRRAVYAAAGNVCEVCGDRGRQHPVEAHEVWHYNDEAPDGALVQVLVRMVALCPACHEVKHFGLTASRGRSVQALAHLAVVNGWSVEDAAQYVRKCFAVWQARSRVPWALDLSGLEPYGSDVVLRFAPGHRAVIAP